MNILFLNSAKDWGGNEKWTLMAASGLAERGHRVFLGCRSSLFSTRDASSGLRYVHMPFLNALDLLTVVKIWWFVVRNNIQIVIPTKQREYFLGGLAARCLPKVKVAARLGIDRPVENMRNRIAFCRLFHGVIVNSRKILTTLSGTPGFDTAKCHLVYNGIDLPQLSDGIRLKYRSELGIAEEEQLIVGIGRLAPQKGFDFALEAFSKLHRKLPSAKLALIGDGSSLEEYKTQAVSAGIKDHVIFTGHRDDISGFLQAADLYWLTSRSEGMSNAMLEAMAHKKAVLAFDVAGVDEAISDGESGVIIKMGDVEELAERSCAVLTDSKFRNSIETGAREVIEKRFTLSKSIDFLEKSLQKIAGMICL